MNYQVRAKKTECLLSSMHRSPDLEQDTEKKKPEMVLFYNKNKVGVDCFDQMARLYTTRSASRRWPLSIWRNMDIAAINAWVMYKQATKTQISQRKFLLLLFEKLTNREATNNAKTAPAQGSSGSIPKRKRRHCYVTDCNNTTVTLCMTCNRPA